MEKKITEPKYWVGDLVVYHVGAKYPRQSIIISAYYNSDWKSECWKYKVDHFEDELSERDIIFKRR